MKSDVTINDVARAAGVSKGTVDRVLHDRGEVSARSRDKILRVIKELGYKPNLYASILASRRNYSIVCLIPEANPGDFWELTEKGILQGKEYAAKFGVSISTVTYDQYELESFQQACAEVLDMEPSGVIIAPMFRNETMKFTKALHENSIPYVYIDSKLEEDDYFAYYGLPMYQSGYLCADILSMGQELQQVDIIRLARDKKGLSDPTVTRRTGFLDYVSEHFPDCVVENTFIDPKNKEQRYRTLDGLFKNGKGHPRNVVMFNSRIHLVAEYLKDRKIRDCRVVGFDVLDRNLAAVREGYVQMLIAQHSDKQTTSAVMALADFLIMQKMPLRKDCYTQIDILNRYNCDYYM